MIENELIYEVNRLDYKWFSEIKQMFVCSFSYNDSIKRLQYTEKKFYSEFDFKKQRDVQEDLVVDCNLDEYCWEYDFKNLRHEGDGTPIEAVIVSMQIERIIATYVQDMNVANLKDFNYADIVIQKHIFVAHAYSIVLKKIFEFREKANDPEYTSATIYFLSRLRQRLYFHYGEFKEKATRVAKIEAFMREINEKLEKPMIEANKKIEIKAEEPIQQPIQEPIIMIDTKIKTKEGTTPKLQWKSKVPLLVYLFRVLQESNIIAGDEWGANLSKIFVDKDYKEIKNTTINEYKQRFKNLDTNPQNKETIDAIVAIIKEVDNQLKM